MESLTIKDLRVEFVGEPVGIYMENPRFSWVINSGNRNTIQKGYRILISKIKRQTTNFSGEFWDSGFINTNKNNNIAYEGNKKLESGQKYYWVVQVTDNFGNEAISDIASFEMGLLDNDDWKAKWITSKQLLRKEFKIDFDISDARIYSSGIGYYKVFINGHLVGDKELNPPWTDYKKRIYYSTYNVKDYIKKGENAIAIILGHGRYIKEYGYDENLQAIMQLEMKGKNGEETFIATDETWKTADGPILYDDIYNGIKYDARKEVKEWKFIGFDDRNWEFCHISTSVLGKLVSDATFPSVKIVGAMSPKETWVINDNAYIFDFGQNFTGWVKLKILGSKNGDSIKVRYSELLNKDKSLNTLPNRTAKNEDEYICRGDAIEIFTSMFTYRGFRYIEISGYPGIPPAENIEGEIVHSAVDIIGNISFDNQLFNKIHNIVRWSQLSNLMSIPTDCPQRDERMGWLGDSSLVAEESIYNFWMVNFYEKWIYDIIDSQLEDGSIPDVVPHYWSLYPADPMWGDEFVVIPYVLYVFYNDRYIVETSYDSIKKWISFLRNKLKNGILKFYKYGDWCPPAMVRPVNTPGELISTWIYIRDLNILSKLAKILDKPDESDKFTIEMNNIVKSFNKTFLTKTEINNPPFSTNSRYGNTAKETIYYYEGGSHTSQILPREGGSQTSQILPIYADLVPDDIANYVKEYLINDILVNKDKHLNTGILGTRYILQTLDKLGYSELAFDIVNQSTYPGWGYMIKEGATTLWERWEYLSGTGMNSHNHIMFGTVDTWFYDSLLGVAPLENFGDVKIQPNITKKLKKVSGSTYTINGLLTMSWEWANENSLLIQLCVPPNSTASLNLNINSYIKNPKIKESENMLYKDKEIYKDFMIESGIIGFNYNNNLIKMSLGSGTYKFEICK